ncbi:MAG: flagellar hook-associated protein FlgL [Solirubrobacteraceae bacterium]|nr:flagellar hook-associated protein FlgL [Solirubrobacteraceae bacterium]
MTIRITGSMTHRALLDNLNASSSRLNTTFDRLSSGRQITKPSDDPYGVTRAMQLRSELSQVAQHQRNVSDGQGWQTVTDSSLTDIADAVRRARTLLVGAGNDVGGPSAREAVAAEIDQLVESIKTSANASFAGAHVFAGAQTMTPPYVVDGTDAYAGDAGAITRTIGPGIDVRVNVDLAGSVLGSGGGDGLLLDTLRTISTHLRGGTAADADALRGADLQAMDASIDALSALRAEVGAAANRLDGAASRLAEIEENALGQRSRIEDADIAASMLDYSSQQTAFQAALQSGAKIMQTSLLDFLR